MDDPNDPKSLLPQGKSGPRVFDITDEDIRILKLLDDLDKGSSGRFISTFLHKQESSIRLDEDELRLAEKQIELELRSGPRSTWLKSLGQFNIIILIGGAYWALITGKPAVEVIQVLAAVATILGIFRQMSKE